MDTTYERYTQASLKTADNLRSIATSRQLRDLSSLSLPEVDATVDLVSRIVPAGNVPGVILSGLARLSGRKPPAKIVKRDVNLLFKGVDRALDKAIYGAFFAGPAAIIWGYQNLLKLAGKDVADSFPEGTWQFYVDYALREDTARHANETHGFDTLLKRHQLKLDSVDRVTAWVMAAIHCLHQYNDLLENEWRERVYISTLIDLIGHHPDAARYLRLYSTWEKQRPYERGTDAEAGESYPAYRQRRFDQFLAEATQMLSDELQAEWQQRLTAAAAEDLPAYQQQMSILAYLEPGNYGETRVPLPLKKAQVGIIYKEHYYLIPACAPRTEQPADVAEVRALVATMMAYPVQTRPVPLVSLAKVKRANWPNLRQKLNQDFLRTVDMLRRTPILLNFDRRDRQRPLAELRQAERGIGDHALTIFDTGETFVFDQSHIFFDGTWGAVLAEVLTNEALAWAVYLNTLPPAQPRQTRPYALTFERVADDLKVVAQAPQIAAEVAAETEAVNLTSMLALRRLFKQRNDLIDLTINDLLVLYRAIHALTYRPDPGLMAKLRQLSRQDVTRQAAKMALETLESSRQISPAIVIPVDGSRRIPRDRIYPMTFEVPLHDLDLLDLHQQVMAALAAYKQASGDRTELYARFDKLQRTYLATLADFGKILSKAKEIAFLGESPAVGTIKFLAHMPPPLQRMLDQIPGRFEVLNDLIRGREVFSNVGAVVPNSTLTRFITAKDDNDKKTLAWGIMTDAGRVMRITLRDFRLYVGPLIAAGHQKLAAQLAQHYLDMYATGLNQFIKDLRQVTQSSRETRFAKPGEEQ